MADPHAVRQQALKLFEGLEELDQPEQLVLPVLLDAIALVEAYRFVRHKDVAYLPELTTSVNALMAELEIIRKTREWAQESQSG